MTATPTNRLIDGYLRQLDRALRGVPRARRRELVEELRAHIADARAEAGGPSEAQTRALLDRLGSPEEIADAARARLGGATQRPAAFEMTAVILLLVGGFAVGVGWLAGAVMLWASDAWTVRDKLIGTLVVPGGLAGSWAVAAFWMADSARTCGTVDDGPAVCHGGASSAVAALEFALTLIVAVAPLVTAWWLTRRARRPAAAIAGAALTA